MTRQMTATRLKETILSVLDDVAAGEEVEITKHGRTVARLVPAGGRSGLPGSMVGLAITADPDDDLFSTGEVWEAQ